MPPPPPRARVAHDGGALCAGIVGGPNEIKGNVPALDLNVTAPRHATRRAVLAGDGGRVGEHRARAGHVPACGKERWYYAGG